MKTKRWLSLLLSLSMALALLPAGAVTARAEDTTSGILIICSEESENGSVYSDKREALPGEDVTLTVTPDPGYKLETLTVKENDSRQGTYNAISNTVSGSFGVGSLSRSTTNSNQFILQIPQYGSGTPTTGISVTATFVQDTGGNAENGGGTVDPEISPVNPVNPDNPDNPVTTSKVMIFCSVESGNGSVSSDKSEASPGERVTLTFTPDPGYKLETLTVKDADSMQGTYNAISNAVLGSFGVGSLSRSTTNTNQFILQIPQYGSGNPITIISVTATFVQGSVPGGTDTGPYTITYHSNYGDGTEEKTFTAETDGDGWIKIGDIGDCRFEAPEGKFLKNWDTLSDGGGNYFESGTVWPFTENTDLYAQWASGHSITVNGASVSKFVDFKDLPKETEAGAEVNFRYFLQESIQKAKLKKILVRYTEGGEEKTIELTQCKRNPTDTISQPITDIDHAFVSFQMPDADVTLIAAGTWNRTITYHSNYGDGTEEKTYVFVANEKANVIIKNDNDCQFKAPEGKSFPGYWNTQPDGGGERVSCASPRQLTEDLDLYAQWMNKTPTTVYPPPPVTLTASGVTLSPASFTYNGKARKPKVTVKAEGKTLKAGTDYKVTYPSGRKNAGKYKVTVTGAGSYTGTVKKTFTIQKAANPMKGKGKTATVKYCKVKKKKQTLKVGTVLTVKKPQGTVTYAKVSGNKKITVAKKTGTVTVKKGLKKGKYKVKVKVKAAGNKNYKATTKTVAFFVRVK